MTARSCGKIYGTPYRSIKEVDSSLQCAVLILMRSVYLGLRQTIPSFRLGTLPNSILLILLNLSELCLHIVTVLLLLLPSLSERRRYCVARRLSRCVFPPH